MSVPSEKDFNKILFFFDFHGVSFYELLEHENLKDYISEMINRYLLEESIDIEIFKSRVGVLNALEYQDLHNIRGITGEMLKWWCLTNP